MKNAVFLDVTSFGSSNTLFRDVTLCGSSKNRRFGRKYRHYHQSERNQRGRNNVSSNCVSAKHRFLQEPHGVIPEDGIVHSHRSENVHSYTSTHISWLYICMSLKRADSWSQWRPSLHCLVTAFNGGLSCSPLFPNCPVPRLLQHSN
jgi:hypothetical protein